MGFVFGRAPTGVQMKRVREESDVRVEPSFGTLQVTSVLAPKRE
jgi:hypothetical protein